MVIVKFSADIIWHYCETSLPGMYRCKMMYGSICTGLTEFLALIVYEYFLTFFSEVTFFWKLGGFSGVTILFLLNRYITLTLQIMYLVPEPSSFQVRCLI